MFAIERQMIIKEMLTNNKSVDVAQLSKLFEVSEITVRRDLDKLEKDGFLIKTYGGAVLNSSTTQNEDAADTDSEHSDAVEIAKLALDMIYDDEVIFLSSGAICEAIAQNLKNKTHLTVVTNDIFVASHLHKQIGITVKLTGGDLRAGSGTLCGYTPIQYIQNIFIGKAFFPVKGVHPDHGYTLDNFDDVTFFREVKKRSLQNIVLAERSRFDRVSLSGFAALDAFDTVVTNIGIADFYKEFYFNNNIKLFTAHNSEP